MFNKIKKNKFHKNKKPVPQKQKTNPTKIGGSKGTLGSFLSFFCKFLNLKQFFLINKGI